MATIVVILDKELALIPSVTLLIRMNEPVTYFGNVFEHNIPSRFASPPKN
jgi:hypothetical protein